MRRLAGVLLLVWGLPAVAAEDFDEWNAKDIMRTCAPCHGEFGQGGGGGVYPRLAGIDAGYLAQQLRLFKSRKRENIPMLPYATERELPERDVQDITRYLASIRLANQLPEQTERMDGLQRLMQAKMVVQIPRAEGDVRRGGKLYDEQCAACHGGSGQGRGDKPALAGQWTTYLQAQIDNFVAGKRFHDDGGLFARVSAADVKDILAYLSILDD